MDDDVATVLQPRRGPVEIITPGVDGVLFAAGDVAELAAAVTLVVGDDALRDRLGDAAMARARDFSPEIIGKAVQEIYRELLARPSKSRRASR